MKRLSALSLLLVLMLAACQVAPAPVAAPPKLVKEGKLSLDDTIDKWFPDQPNGDKITVRMLLSHTSGLSEFITPENPSDPKWSHEFPPIYAVAE